LFFSLSVLIREREGGREGERESNENGREKNRERYLV